MKRKAVIGILILCIMLGSAQLLLNVTNPTKAARKIKYDPIIIDGNGDFARQARRKGWPGSGTSYDPYIIENYDLTIPYKKGKKSTIPPVAISISNTNVYFKIRYSTISNYNGEIDGILLRNVKNGEIFNNTIFNFVNGILLDGSDYINITQNIIQAYSEITAASPPSQNIRYRVDKVQAFISRGVFLDPSNHNIIANNTISGFTETGVELLDSVNNTIDGNKIDSSIGKNGVFLNGSSYNNIINNEIWGHNNSLPEENSISQNIRYKVGKVQAFISRGVFLDPSDHNIIANNNISGFTGTGVELLNSVNNSIDGNKIDSSIGENGVFLKGSSYNNITNNEVWGYNNSLPGESPISQNIRYRVGKVQAFISRGVFLDPSDHNIIANNTISGFTGAGVELLDSANNTIDRNEIVNSFGDNENGVFLNGSSYNNITNNEIYGYYDNSLPEESPISQNIRYRVDRTQAFISRGVFLDPSNHNIIANNTISNITGTGVELFNATNNTIDWNEISNNAENGILLQGSNNTNVSHNVIYNDDIYGVTISSFSNNNNIDWNDFIGNNIGGTSQLNDDGSENQFSNNFLVDHDNTDTDNDSISDSSYQIDGDADSLDYSPYAIPIQPLKDLGLALADLDADVDWESETLNLKNQGNWETVKISLPVGYSATNIDVSSIYTEVYGAGRLYADEEAQVQNPRTLTVKFDRPTLVLLLNKSLTSFPTYVNMNVTGFLNGEFLMFYGYDEVKILNDDGTANPVMAIDQEMEKPVDNPTQMILIDQITSVSQKPFALTIGILFAPIITTVVIRRFHRKR